MASEPIRSLQEYGTLKMSLGKINTTNAYRPLIIPQLIPFSEHTNHMNVNMLKLSKGKEAFGTCAPSGEWSMVCVCNMEIDENYEFGNLELLE